METPDLFHLTIWRVRLLFFLRQDGMTYRLVPVANGNVNADWCYDEMMNNLHLAMQTSPVFILMKENRRHLNTIRLQYAQAAGYLADMGRKKKRKNAG